MILTPLLLSLWVAGCSTVLVVISGLPLARWLARCGRAEGRAERRAESRAEGRAESGAKGRAASPILARIVDALVTAPLVLPPVFTGYVLLSLFSPRGPAGQLLDRLLGASILFHWTGAVLASAVVAFPLLVRSARAALESVPHEYLEAAEACGSAPRRLFFSVHLPLALPGIAAGTVLAFARGLGEFGATVIVAGNIPGKTQTLPLAMYQAIAAGDGRSARAMAIAITAVAAVLLLLVDRFQRRAGFAGRALRSSDPDRPALRSA